jgi:hypothetical protein
VENTGHAVDVRAWRHTLEQISADFVTTRFDTRSDSRLPRAVDDRWPIEDHAFVSGGYFSNR